MFFSTVVLNGGSTPFMHPEMPFRRIVFSTFFPRASFHTTWVIREWVRPAAGPAMSAIFRITPSLFRMLNALVDNSRFESVLDCQQGQIRAVLAFRSTTPSPIRAGRQGRGYSATGRTGVRIAPKNAGCGMYPSLYPEPNRAEKC
jgi:hypothetical protein